MTQRTSVPASEYQDGFFLVSNLCIFVNRDWYLASPNTRIGRCQVPVPCHDVEIYEWLRLNASDNPLICKYAIIDDDINDFLLLQKDNLVATNPWDGITKDVAEKAIRLLLE